MQTTWVVMEYKLKYYHTLCSSLLVAVSEYKALFGLNLKLPINVKAIENTQ